jgi:uncharacterized delta-60 repeat protein
MKTTFTLIALCFSVLLNAQKAGTLDSSFGVDGKVISRNFGTCNTMAIQKDGKIVCAGTITNVSDTDFRLVRYLANGILDSSFGKQGIADIVITETSSETVGIKIQDDQKIVVVGWGYKHGMPTFVIARCLPDGSLDENFGINGIVDTAFGIGESIPAVGLQSDGKILVTGWYAPSSYITVRYNIDGSIDESFGNGGTVFTNFGVFVIPSSIVVQPDNKIVVGGSTSEPAKFLLVRYMPDGTLDNSFGNKGKVITDFGQGDDVINNIALQADGKIVVSGTTNNSNLDNMALARYQSNGTPDSSFNGNGKVTCKFEGFYSRATSALIQGDGEIIISGYVFGAQYGDFAMARYLPNGSSDSSFGINSKVITDMGLIDMSYSSALQNNEKIILAGSSLIINSDTPQNNFALARYNNDATKKQIIIKKIKHYIQTHNNAQATTLNTVSMYPNPAQNILHVQGLSSTQTKLTVVDFNGVVALSVQPSAFSSSYNLNIASLHAGNYLLKIETNGAVVTKQFVKE